MFENFTERCRKVISLSRQEAQRLGGEYIGTEHLLLGILQEGGGVAARVLKNQDIDFQRVRREVEQLMDRRESAKDLLGQLPFSPLAKRTIELAAEAASTLGHDRIGTEHLLLGLTQGTEGIAATVLTALKLDYATTRELVLKLLTQGPLRPDPSSQSPPPPAERNMFDRAQAYLALADRPALQESIVRHLQQERSLALVGPKYVGKTSLLLALSRAKAGGFVYCSIDFRIFDEFHAEELSLPKRAGIVCFVPEGELVTASRSLAADLLDERRRGGQRLILEFREGGLEAYATRYPDLAKELVRVDVSPPDPAECARLMETTRPRLKDRMGLELPDDAIQEADRLARARWPKMVAPWPALITLWKAAAIQNESASRGDLPRLEQDIAALEASGDAAKKAEADLLRRHVEGLRGVGQTLTLESIRQAISELADKPSAHF